MQKIPVSNLDLVFLSYDEPNAEANWADLLSKAGWAQRVHGVRGFDSAHKACAELATTDHFITVDGDNIVYPEFFDIEIDILDPRHTYSCNSRNSINGLCYGNGGIKIWNRQSVLDMQTHENAVNDAERVDFCWSSTYIQLNNVYSDTNINTTPFQAFRAGFREGVKMLLNRGRIIDLNKIKTEVWQANYNRCLIWANIGADVKNGLWAIYGTRLGLYMMAVDKNFNMFDVADYEWFKRFWLDQSETLANDDILVTVIKNLGKPLREFDLEIPDFVDAHTSLLFKQTYQPPRRLTNPMITEAEVQNASV